MKRRRSFSIRAKTTCFVIATLGVLIGLIATISFTSSLSRIEMIENERSVEELGRVGRQLENSLVDLGGTNADWAWWDDSYEFVQERNTDYIDNNLYAEAFSPLGVDIVAFVGLDGEVIHQAWFTDDGEQPVPEALLNQARPGGLLADYSEDTQATPSGLIRGDGSVFLATGRALIRSDFSGEPVGVLLMARVVDSDFVAELADLTGLSADLTPCALGSCEGFGDLPTISKSADSIAATTVIASTDGNAALLLHIDSDRHIYRQSIDGIRSVLFIVIAVGVLAVLLTITGIRRLVVGPLEELGLTVADVGRTNDPSLRAAVDRRDEIGDLAADLNIMLSRLERSQNELLKAKSEIEGASAAKSKFLARVSHEVRTPLNGVLAYAQLLQLGDLDADSAESVGQIVVAARHITQLVDDFLDIARIEAGAIPLSIETVDTASIVNEVIALTQPVAAEHGARVVITGLGARPAQADVLRLRQVLLNLVSNAIKYGGTTHSIKISTEQRDERSFIIVADHGPGISADQLHRLFVPFDRLDADQGTKSGTGIGLSVTKQLVELMDGSIEVISEVGTGSAFIVSLPSAPIDALARIESASTAPVAVT